VTNVNVASRKMPKMLIADDDPAIVRLLAERCASMGFEVETASNGIQALLRANRTQPDILIIDVNMPKADGLSVCAQLRDPVKNPFDVVVVTGRRDPETIKWCKNLGAFYTYKGPDFWNDLASALGEIFPGMVDRIRELKINPAGTQIQKHPRLLVVDDDADIKSFFVRRLDKSGVETLYASNAMQGYRMACEEEPSVIVSDYFMPNGDAFYLLWRLRTTAVTENIPLFVFSGFQLDEPTQKTLKREIYGRPGAVGIFQKSFDTRELFGALQQFCSFEKNRVEA
jgi:CheY-like chemotaxis protein